MNSAAGTICAAESPPARLAAASKPANFGTSGTLAEPWRHHRTTRTSPVSPQAASTTRDTQADQGKPGTGPSACWNVGARPVENHLDSGSHHDLLSESIRNPGEYAATTSVSPTQTATRARPIGNQVAGLGLQGPRRATQSSPIAYPPAHSPNR